MSLDRRNTHVTRSRFILLPLLAVVVPFSGAQSRQQELKGTDLTNVQREALARPILLHAETSAATLDPGARGYLLYRLAGAWFAMDRSRSIRLYKDAFYAAYESDPKIRELLEAGIVQDLIPISPTDAFDFLPRTEGKDTCGPLYIHPTAKSSLYAALIRYALVQGDYPLAIRAFDSAVAAGGLTEQPVVRLVASLPAGADTERVHVFTAAMMYYEKNPYPVCDGWTSGLSDLVARFYPQLPPRLVLHAIDIVLAQAEQDDPMREPSISFVGNFAFHTYYDYQLFIVTPALRTLDQDRAAALLSQHAEAAAAFRQFPQGLASIDPGLNAPGFSKTQEALAVDHTKPSGLLLFNEAGEAPQLTHLDLGLEFTVHDSATRPSVAEAGVFFASGFPPDNAILDRTGPCPANVGHKLELAEAVPILRRVCFASGGAGCMGEENTFPRSKLIQAIAERCTYFGDPASARLALHDQLEILPHVPEEDRIDFLAAAADLYLRLGDAKAAGSVLRLGVAAASTIYDRDSTAVPMAKFPKAMWFAAEAYRQMLALSVNSNFDSIRKAVDQIPDPVLAEYERVMLARALLGVPVHTYLRAWPNGAVSWQGTSPPDDFF